MSRFRLLELEPELTRFLSSEERDAAERLTVPLVTIRQRGVDVVDELHRHDVFGAVVVEGMLVERFIVGEHAAMHLLGRGDIVAADAPGRPMLVAAFECRTAARTDLALLGPDVLAAIRRWPALVLALHHRRSEQSDRLAAQLAICQLPRVEQRLLALLWLLAEAWGRVTPMGTTLPLSLTHEALGSLIGARRPTVTLALRELADRGAVVRQDGGWLLLEPPPSPGAMEGTTNDAGLLEQEPSVWSPPAGFEPAEHRGEHQALIEAVSRLRAEHDQRRNEVRDQLARAIATRERCRMTRRRIVSQRTR